MTTRTIVPSRSDGSNTRGLLAEFVAQDIEALIVALFPSDRRGPKPRVSDPADLFGMTLTDGLV